MTLGAHTIVELDTSVGVKMPIKRPVFLVGRMFISRAYPLMNYLPSSEIYNLPAHFCVRSCLKAIKMTQTQWQKK